MAKLTNIEMERMLGSLAPLLSQRNMVGYAAARNTRILRDSLTEYTTMRDSLVERYGDPVTDDDGNFTGQVSIHPGTESFSKFAEDIEPFMGIVHDVDIYRISITEAIGRLSGEEILAAEWMFDGEVGPDGALR